MLGGHFERGSIEKISVKENIGVRSLSIRFGQNRIPIVYRGDKKIVEIVEIVENVKIVDGKDLESLLDSGVYPVNLYLQVLHQIRVNILGE
jgi:hypothetical protein